MSAFEASTSYEATHPSALAMYCSDGRFTNAVEELLQSIGYDRLDTLTMPGGPGLLGHLTASALETQVAINAASFLIKGHSIRDVYLLAHAGCGYYRKKRTKDSPEQIRACQLDDLKSAGRSLREVKPDLGVHLYYAQPHDGVITFESVDFT